MITIPRVILSTLLAFSFGTDAFAEEPQNQDGWTFNVGAGLLLKPAFLGADEYQAMAFPDIKVEYGERFFASVAQGVGYNLINHNGWRVGPIAKLDFGRDEEDDSPFRIIGDRTDALRGLGDIDPTAELGAFVEYTVKPISYSLELRQGVGGHEGFLAEAALNYTGFAKQLGRSIIYAFGPRATFADSSYNDAFFGITETQSANSGLSQYNADAGLLSYGIGGFAPMPLTDSLSVGLFGGYERLAGDAADSPLVRERGDENQFVVGTRVSYEFEG